MSSEPMSSGQRSGGQIGREPINGQQPTMIEWGGAGPAERLTGGLDRLKLDGPVGRRAGMWCAVAGFGLLLAAEVLPWMTVTTTSLPQDFPTVASGRVSSGAGELNVATDILNLGWLVVLAVLAAALVIGPALRRVVVATGLGLVAGQLALLAGVTRGIEHATKTTVFRGALVTSTLPVELNIGLYCAYGAVGLFAAALLLTGGVPRRLREAVPLTEEADPSPRGPADLTVTPIPSADPAADLSPWSRRGPDIDVSGRSPDR
jgi:hypothetical protein